MHPRLQALYDDPCTPYWAKDLLKMIAISDLVDVINVLTVITQECQMIFRENTMTH